jgi:Purple acid Phosphatase, N-terminal domain
MIVVNDRVLIGGGVMRIRTGILATTVALLLCLTPSASAQATELQITSNPRVEHISNSAANIQWSTNIPATALVRYGRDFQNLNEIAESTENGQSHNVQLNNLRSGTTYFYQVVSSTNGIRAITQVNEFVTSGDFVPYYTEPVNSSPH